MSVLPFNMWLDANRVLRQTGATEQVISSPVATVSFPSQSMSLQPGDVMSTGTPPGAGLGFKPSGCPKAGDTTRRGIQGWGEQHQHAVAAR